MLFLFQKDYVCNLPKTIIVVETSNQLISKNTTVGVSDVSLWCILLKLIMTLNFLLCFLFVTVDEKVKNVSIHLPLNTVVPQPSTSKATAIPECLRNAALKQVSAMERCLQDNFMVRHPLKAIIYSGPIV